MGKAIGVWVNGMWAPERQAGDGCWEWPHARIPQGYGVKRVNYKLLLVHRASYEAYVGPIPEGLTIDHLCRNRACYNPAHLEAVTMAENVRRGSATRAYVRNATCPKGHPKDGLVKDADGRGGYSAYCKTCSRDRQRARRAAVAA